MKELGEIIRIEKGAHKTFQDGNCAMELVAFMAGEPHSDHPACAIDRIIALEDGPRPAVKEVRESLCRALNAIDEIDKKS